MRTTEFYRVRIFQGVKKDMAAYKEPRVFAKCFLLKENHQLNVNSKNVTE